jgi:hypothetical protein
MLTLSLVFEDRDEHGLLKDYERFDLDSTAGLYLCDAMRWDQDWCRNMTPDAQLDLLSAVLDFIIRYDPDAILGR